MKTKIMIRRSSVAGKKPTNKQVDKGELAINTADGKLFTQNESGAIVEIGSTNGVIRDEGLITSIASIKKSGIYHGTNITDGPMPGKGGYIRVFATFDSPSSDKNGYLAMIDDSVYFGSTNTKKVYWMKQVYEMYDTVQLTKGKLDVGDTGVKNAYVQLIGTSGMFAIKPNAHVTASDWNVVMGKHNTTFITDLKKLNMEFKVDAGHTIKAKIGNVVSDVLLSSGSSPMIAHYVPKVDQDIATKKFVEDAVKKSSKSTVIHSIAQIKNSGYYEGTNITGSPVKGKVNITATKDTAGDIGLTLKDATLRVYEGGIPHGGTAHWKHVAPDHLFGTAVPSDSLGKDGDLYFKLK